MTYPHNFDPAKAPPVYLYRYYVSKRPKQITFCAMVGSFKMHIIDISDEISALTHLDETAEAIIKQRIIADRDNSITRIYGDVKCFILVVGEKPIAKYSLNGDCIGAADDFTPVPINARAGVAGSDAELRLV